MQLTRLHRTKQAVTACHNHFGIRVKCVNVTVKCVCKVITPRKTATLLPRALVKRADVRFDRTMVGVVRRTTWPQGALCVE